jgi:hypothetical protein
VDKLVGDPGFLRYHAEYAKRREFNAFDVLRYAEYEIRHSNVVAWLLDPDETHGIGRAFLEWFLGEVKFPGKTALRGTIVRGDGGQRVRVERELHYVDVTIFLESEQGRHIVAVENKPGWASAEHYDQIRGYEEKLREEYPGHEIHSLLLSASPEGIDGERKIGHVSWRDVGAQVEKMLDAGDFAEREVAAFIRQYLVAVARMIGPEESDAHYFRKLLDDHHSLLTRMFRALVDEGDDGVRAMVPDRQADFRDTVVRLVKDFGREPERLRSVVRDLLTGRGIETWVSGGGTWLSWDIEQNGKLWRNGRVYWVLAFHLRRVMVHLEVFPRPGEALKRILRFMRGTPIDRRRRDRYQQKGAGYGYVHLYSHELVGDDVLSGRSTAAVTEAVREAVENFLDSEDSDYNRVGDYFRCLAFGNDAVAVQEEDTA